MSEDVTYYAHWNKDSYRIAYDLKGGTGNPGPATYDVDTATFSLVAPTYTGHRFAGWTGSNGYTPEEEVTIPKGSTGDRSYVANWEVGGYVVTFDANGGIGDMADQTFVYGEAQRLLANEFTNGVQVKFDGNRGTPATSSITSYREFLGWAESSGGEKKYSNRQNVKDITTDPSITLYAKWGGLG